MKKYEILSKRTLAERVNEYVVYAPAVARHARAGQFVILRTDEDGERVPFTVCDYSREEGTVSVLVQEVGYTTMKLAAMNAGDALADFVGPLGNPTDLSAYKRILLVGGGIGGAVIYPQAKQLAAEGKPADVVLGARNVSLAIYTEEFACAHGPEFDGHQVDFDEAIARSRMYREQEQAHICRLTGEVRR